MRLIPKSNELIQKLYEWNLDEEMRLKQNGFSLAYDWETCAQFYNSTYDGHHNILVGVQGDSGDIVGVYMIEGVDKRNLRCQMHYAFCKEGRGKPLLESYKIVMDYVFKELHMQTVYGTIAANNQKAMTFIEKVGWKKIAELPQYFSTPIGFIPGCLFFVTQDMRLDRG